MGGGAIILLNFPTLKWGVLTHKHDPKRVCKFKLDHLGAPGAIFGDFFFRGGAPRGPQNIDGTKKIYSENLHNL